MAGVADNMAAEQCRSLLIYAEYENAEDMEKSEHQRRHIAFRDRPCSHPEDARKYEQLKIKLAEMYRNDRIG